jgi:hypothetical protein
VDITRDVMQMTRDGKETAEIRAFVDEKYSQYGPPTETGPVPASQFSMIGPSLPGSAEPLPAGVAQVGPTGSCGEAASACQEISK